MFGLPALPLPAFSNPVGGENASGLLSPDIRYDVVNGLGYAQPYFFALAPNQGTDRHAADLQQCAAVDEGRL